MAFNPLSGKLASVSIGTLSYAFQTWEASMENKLVSANNFNGGGFEQWVDGLTGASVTLTGIYDEGNMPFTVGNSYSATLAYTTSVSLIVPIVVKSVKPKADVNGDQHIEVTAQSNGSFTAAIL